MIRREFLGALSGLLLAARAASAAGPEEPIKIVKLELTEEEWRKRLSAQQFAVLRQEATERAGSSPLNNEKRKGHFACAGCDLPLFTSEAKYESGTGWPSFYAPIAGRLGTKT